ncbi:MAG: hypothetical protein EBY48_10940 [Opitutae bacterium]|nr:hypothetical protein [Opitutae bacterium]
MEAHLRERLNSFIESGQFNLVRADAVKQPIGNLPDDIEEYAVVANLPYAISSAWMEGLLGSGKLPTSMVMMLQKEATERMLASLGTKAYNALAIFLQSAYQQTGYHPVPGQCFYPAPAVASALLKMEKKTTPYLFAKETRSLIRRIFTQRRKQIGSLLKKEEQEIQQIMTSWLEENNICSTTRPEKISVDQWTKLGKLLPSTN